MKTFQRMGFLGVVKGPKQLLAYNSSEEGRSEEDRTACGIIIGGNHLQLKSLGRQGSSSQNEHQKTSLSQCLVIESFFIDTLFNVTTNSTD